MDRLGRLITRWVHGDDGQSKRNSILGTVLPVIPPSTGAFIVEQHRSDTARHATLSKKLNEALIESSHLIVDGRLMYIEGAHDRELMATAHAYELGGRIKAVVAKFPEYEANTLQVVYDRMKGTSHILRVLEKAWSSETEMRESLHFSTIDKSGNLQLPKTNYFQPIREGLFDVNCLSEFPDGSAEYEAVRSALGLISLDYWELNADKDQWNSRPVIVIDPFAKKRPEWAEPEVAVWLTKLTLEHPDRIDDIKQYLIDRKVSLNEVDAGHLEEYLNTAAPVLAEGAL